jgi:DedD protein
VKERLTGAIILVALIVLLVPELLRGPVRSVPRTVAAPAEEGPLRSVTINLADDSQAHNGSAQPQPSAPQPMTATPGAVPVPTPPESAAPEPTATAAPAPAAAPPATPRPASPPPAHASPPAASPPVAATEAAGAFMVQLGSFASRPNAERLAQQLKSQGFTAGVSQGSTGRHLYRVRVGPVRDKAAAAQLQAKLKAAGHSGAVVPR